MNKIFNEAEEHFKGRVTRAQIKEAFILLFYNVADVMRTNHFPTITIPKFLTIKPKQKGLEDYLKKLEQNYPERENDIFEIKKAIKRNNNG